MTDGSAKSGERVTPAGAPRRDLAVAAVLVVLGIAVIGWDSRCEPGVQTDPLGPGAFPLALGAAIAVCGLLLGATALLGDRWTAVGRDVRRVRATTTPAREEPELRPGGSSVPSSRPRPTWSPSSASGYLLATAAATWWRSCSCTGRPGARVLTAPVLVTVALYAAFRFGLLIPVPDGILEPWLPW